MDKDSDDEQPTALSKASSNTHQRKERSLADLERRHLNKIQAANDRKELKEKVAQQAKENINYHQFQNVYDDDDSSEDEEGTQKVEKISKEADFAKKSFVELFAKRKNILEQVKERIATAANLVMEYPEANIKHLNKLFQILDSSSDDPEIGVVFFSAQKLVIQSLCVIFSDIVPNYR